MTRTNDNNNDKNPTYQGENESPDGHLGVPDLDGDDTKDEHDEEQDHIPPVGDLGVLCHETSVDVALLGHGTTSLDPDLLAVVHKGVRDGSRDGSEAETVRERKGGGKEQRRVGLVLFVVERALGGDDPGDIVHRAGVVVRGVGRDGEVLGVKGVGVVEDGGEEPEEEDDGGGNVALGPPWGGEGRADEGDLGPVEGEHGHSEAGSGTKELVDGDVVGNDPTYPVEIG